MMNGSRYQAPYGLDSISYDGGDGGSSNHNNNSNGSSHPPHPQQPPTANSYYATALVGGGSAGAAALYNPRENPYAAFLSFPNASALAALFATAGGTNGGPPQQQQQHPLSVNNPLRNNNNNSTTYDGSPALLHPHRTSHSHHSHTHHHHSNNNANSFYDYNLGNYGGVNTGNSNNNPSSNNNNNNNPNSFRELSPAPINASVFDPIPVAAGPAGAANQHVRQSSFDDFLLLNPGLLNQPGYEPLPTVSGFMMPSNPYQPAMVSSSSQNPLKAAPVAADAWLDEMKLTVSGISLDPLSGSAIVSRLRAKMDDVQTRYLPCVDFLVQCQQELRKGLAVATQKRVVGGGKRNYSRDYMTPRQFYSAYIEHLPSKFFVKNQFIMEPVALRESCDGLRKLAEDSKSAERQGCEAVKNAFLGGMKEGESWGLRKWLSKNGNALTVCTDLECILKAVQQLDKQAPNTRKLAEILCPMAKQTLDRLRHEIPASYQERSTAHPYLPFFHRLEAALLSMSNFDPDDDDVVCLDDSDDDDEPEPVPSMTVSKPVAAAAPPPAVAAAPPVAATNKPKPVIAMLDLDDDDDDEQEDNKDGMSSSLGSHDCKIDDNSGSTLAVARGLVQGLNMVTTLATGGGDDSSSSGESEDESVIEVIVVKPPGGSDNESGSNNQNNPAQSLAKWKCTHCSQVNSNAVLYCKNCGQENENVFGEIIDVKLADAPCDSNEDDNNDHGMEEDQDSDTEDEQEAFLPPPAAAAAKQRPVRRKTPATAGTMVKARPKSRAKASTKAARLTKPSRGVASVSKTPSPSCLDLCRLWPVAASDDEAVVMAHRMADNLERMAALFDQNKQEMVRPRQAPFGNFWDGERYGAALKILSNLLREPESTLFVQRPDEDLLIEQGNPPFSHIIKHPLSFQDICSALIRHADSKIPAGGRLTTEEGLLHVRGLNGWNMWKGVDFLQAIDLVFLNSLAYGKHIDASAKSRHRSQTNKLRKSLWNGITSILQQHCKDQERRKECTPTRRSETSGFVVYKISHQNEA